MDGSSDHPQNTPFWRSLVTFLLQQPNVLLLLVLQVAFFWYFTYVRIVVSYVAPLLGVLGALSVVVMLGLVNMGLARLEDEWLFDLEKDPHEDTNLLSTWDEKREPLPTMVRDLGGIYLNQRLLDEDRFVPSGRKN